MRVAFALLTVVSAFPAAAHIRMDFPIGRYSDDFLKDTPCGKGAGDPRSGNVNTFEPGATITVRFTETIDHAGFYRVAFDEDGADAADFDAADAELGRLDDPADPDGVEKTIAVTLPDVECARCTLQLTQDMTGSLYYQCADLVLATGAGNDVDDGKAAGPLRQGCSGAGAGLPLALLTLLLRRRRA